MALGLNMWMLSINKPYKAQTNPDSWGNYSSKETFFSERVRRHNKQAFASGRLKIAVS